jgi:hypothetical protein
MSEVEFDLTEAEAETAQKLYEQFGEIDKYDALDIMLKRTAACVVLGVTKHMTPDQVREMSDNDDFRANADSLILAYEMTHPDKLGPKFHAAEFIMELSAKLDHSQCDHEHDDADAHAFVDTSERMTIPDADVEAKFNDIMAGFEDAAEEPAARPASFEVRTDGETTDQRDGQA